MCDVRGVQDEILNFCALGNVSSLTGVAATDHEQRNTRPDRHCRLHVCIGDVENPCANQSLNQRSFRCFNNEVNNRIKQQ